MSTLVFDDAYVALNSTQLTGIKSVSLSIQYDPVDDTVMSDDFHSNKPGLGNWNATIEFAQDFDAGAIDAQIDNIRSTTFLAEFRPTTSAVSTQNPKYHGWAMLTESSPFSGSVGDFATMSVGLTPAKTSTGGSTGMNRATS